MVLILHILFMSIQNYYEVLTMNSIDHYNKISSIYDDLWFYSPDYVDKISDQIINLLELKIKDIFLDLGCGTGIYAKAINKKINFESPIICSDISKKMLEGVKSEPNINSIAIDAIDFSSLGITVDKILIKELIHHIDNPRDLFSKLSNVMSCNGILLLMLLPPTITYPLFSDAIKLYEERQPHYNKLTNELTDLGFSTTVDFVGYELEISKNKYIEMVRNRYMSLLSNFSDDELEEGILEMEENSKSLSSFKFVDRFSCIKAIK